MILVNHFGDLQTHHQRAFVIRSGCERVALFRRVLAHGLGLLDALSVGQQRRVQGGILEKQLLESFLVIQDEVARAILGKAGGIALVGECVVVVQDVERIGGLDAVGVKTGKDGAVDDIGIFDEHERVYIGAVRVADMNNLGGQKVKGSACVAGSLGGARQLSAAGDFRQAGQDLDFHWNLDVVVSVWLLGCTGAKAVVREDGVALVDGGINVGVLLRINLHVKVSKSRTYQQAVMFGFPQL